MKLVEIWETIQHQIHRYSRSYLILIGMSLVMGLLSQGSIFDFQLAFKEGDVAPQDVKAPTDLRIIDEFATQRRREAVAASVREVYDFDSDWLEASLGRFDESIRLLSDTRFRRTPDRHLKIEQQLKMKISNEELNFLLNTKYAELLKFAMIERLRDPRRIWLFRELPSDTITLRDVATGQEMTLSRSAMESQAQTTAAARAEILSTFRNQSITQKWTSAQFKVVQSLLNKFLIENVSFNPVETAARRDEAKAKLDPTFLEIKRGEMLLREGQRVEKQHLYLLQSLKEAKPARFDFVSLLSFSALFAFITVVLYSVGRRNFKKFRLSLRDQLVMGSFLVASSALLTGLYFLFRSARESSLVASLLIYLLPVGFAGMTFRLFASMEITTFCAILQGIGMAWIMKNPYFALMSLCASLAGAARMRRISQRMDVFRAGLTSGIVFGIMVLIGLGLDRIETQPFESVWVKTGLIIFFSLGSGVLSAGFVLAIQPLLENLGYTTDLRLMELSRTDHPLLKDLILKAPGTYFHSFTVSQLAEKAADAIHANGLFARVAALYHDVGKTKKPQYFIENIKGENKHDKLVPTMSALIISNHVKDGIELALEHKLPPNIIEIIPQHHGTSLIAYFYDKALRNAQGSDVVNEQDFRYPGPKPQTKEAAIILMADAVEATAKAMGNSTEDQLRQMVHKTIQRFFLDGQLDECDLSLKDLAAIGNAFLQVLQGVYHNRIDYPQLKLKTNA